MIGLVTIARLMLRYRTRQPERLKTGNALIDGLAIIVHGAIYLAVIGMLTSGVALALFSGFPGILFGAGGAAPPLVSGNIRRVSCMPSSLELSSS